MLYIYYSRTPEVHTQKLQDFQKTVHMETKLRCGWLLCKSVRWLLKRVSRTIHKNANCCRFVQIRQNECFLNIHFSFRLPHNYHTWFWDKTKDVNHANNSIITHSVMVARGH